MKLFFYSPILTNNNLLLKIYCENIVIEFLNCHFLFFILFFLYFIHTFVFFFFLFFFSRFSPPHMYTHSYLYSPFFFLLLFLFLLDSRTSFSLSFSNSLSFFYQFGAEGAAWHSECWFSASLCPLINGGASKISHLFFLSTSFSISYHRES